MLYLFVATALVVVTVIVGGLQHGAHGVMGAPIVAVDAHDEDLQVTAATNKGREFEFEFDPSLPLLAPGTAHSYRYRTRTLTTPHEGASSAGVELTCIVRFEVEPAAERGAIVTMHVTQPHVFRIGTAIPKEKG